MTFTHDVHYKPNGTWDHVTQIEHVTCLILKKRIVGSMPGRANTQPFCLESACPPCVIVDTPLGRLPSIVRMHACVGGLVKVSCPLVTECERKGLSEYVSMC